MTWNHNESLLAAAFATLVCAWAVSLVVIGLGSTSRTQDDSQRPSIVAAAARP